ncbi:MAG: DEAD/DEAH box helicase family protein [Bacteroidetes bacterium]|nr:DEAD/DEAH box helicase family protein [Bacteroidota bacterium]
MELKKYQREVLTDLEEFCQRLNREKNLKTTFQQHWEKRGVVLNSNDDFFKPYNNTIQGIPRVLLKVPTAGGKTFIACNALSIIFDNTPSELPKVVAWFVPSDTILKQTFKNLNNPNHPYRQRIDSLFNGRVQVVDKEAALMGQGISPIQIKEQLTIFVLSIQSFASTTKEGRRVYQENENLAEYGDETALINVLAKLNPVVIIDESHNFGSDLRVEVLQTINPRFILDLTATPRDSSNIISIVNSMQLKRENMVKLPVIVYNHHTTNEVLVSSIQMQRTLEYYAKEQEKNGGRYIRPIVLLQAQPKTAKESIDYQKIKEQLLEIGVPDEQIKIKTGDKNEIGNMDLLSRDCEVRFIITVNALKEGWDCPFAYVLASIANRSSAVDVEQILGRILRQPYTEKQQKDLLNLCYVFTSSNDFNAAINSIIKSLNNEGFSERDYRIAQSEQLYKEEKSTNNTGVHEQIMVEMTEEIKETEINVEEIKGMLESNENEKIINTVIENAEFQSRQFDEMLENIKNDEFQLTAPEITKKQKKYQMREIFRASAKSICLPVFKKRIINNSVFEEAGSLIQLTKGMLAEGFDLSKADRNIDFTQANTEAVAIDIDETGGNEYVPEYQKLNKKQLQYIKESFISNSTEGQRERLSGAVAKRINISEVSEPNIKNYVKDVVKNLDRDQIIELYEYLDNTASTIQAKIALLLKEHEKNKFIEDLDTGEIICDPQFKFKQAIVPLDVESSIGKSLYSNEGTMNKFEKDVITEIATLDNVEWWHRNLDNKGKGFYINSYINHYPDFIVKLKNGRIIIIETKGDDRDNSDSKQKLEIGKKWEAAAGNNYRYYMVFDKIKLEGAITVKELLNRIEMMR